MRSALFTDVVRRKHVVLALASLALVWLLCRSPPRPPVVDRSSGLLEEVSPGSRFAIATFLSADGAAPDEDVEDPEAADYYYAATRVLAYQLLHADPTRIRNTAIDFLVLVTADVSRQKRSRLSKDGAVVVPVDAIPLNWWISTGVTRWKDQFTKLRLFEMDHYDRVLFLDADTLLTAPLDAIFLEPGIQTPNQTLFDRTSQVKGDESPLPAHYVFAARSDNALSGERAHPFPPAHTTLFSAGFWVAAPSRALFDNLMSVMQHYRRFNPHTMEQSLLNYVFRRDGAMPWTELDYHWSATWPSERDLEGGVRSLHEKLGMEGPPEVLRRMWWDLKAEMGAFYERQSGWEDEVKRGGDAT